MTALDRYFAPPFKFQRGPKAWVIESTIHAAIRDARSVTGRDPSTGQASGPTLSWSGAVTYLVALEQLGQALRLATPDAAAEDRIKFPFGKTASNPGANEQPFRSALVLFTSLNEDEIGALYALRCSFVHRFSMANLNSNRPDLTHRFVFRGDGPLIDRSSPWGGTWGDPGAPKPGDNTFVNLTAVGDLAEGAVVRAAHRQSAGELATVPSTEAEFDERYSFGMSMGIARATFGASCP